MKSDYDIDIFSKPTAFSLTGMQVIKDRNNDNIKFTNDK